MNLQTLTTSLRQFRNWHKWVGISVAFFMLITAATGLLLGWKKNIDLLQPPTRTGTTSDLRKWISFESVVVRANHALDSLAIPLTGLEKLDVRTDKGIIKIIYLHHWEVQMDGQSGKIFSVAKRHADWIEHIHDGSIISDGFKLLYTNYLGWGLLILSLTGFWLWYGPRRMRQIKKNPS
jgi:uncharacterized iron-regulated membrane protein